jgi:hypothetical protein
MFYPFSMMRRSISLLVGVTFLFFLFIFSWLWLGSQFSVPIELGNPFDAHYSPPIRFVNRTEMVKTLLATFRDLEPVPKTIKVTKQIDTSGELQTDKLADAVDFDPQYLEQMQHIHLKVIQNLPEFPSHLFQGGRGIVTVAGGNYLRIAYLSILMLRQTGMTLPIELWMADWSEYNARFCAEVETHNVRCEVLADYLGEHIIDKYQLKSFAILLSSFSEVLFLDADDFPVNSVDDIFVRGDYTKTGVVIWPDYWAATTSPWLFRIVNKTQTFMRTCEAGQLIWNKRTHFTSLALACYYNLYGPDYFYPLLSLGTAGQGDKETFRLACEVMGHSYTFTDTEILTLGYHDLSGFHGTGMGQADPRNISRYVFLHAHFPKINAQSLFASGSLRNSEGQRILAFWGAMARKMGGYDVEAVAFRKVAYIECNSSLADASSVICDRVLEHIAALEQG